jgi:uncharacterized protein (TIGR02001 family)
MQIKTLSVLYLALAGSGAFAQTKAPEPDYTFAYNIGVFSDYRFRGISQTRLDPAVQGGIDFTHKSGLYLGAWASNIKWIKDAGGKNSNLEIDLYGGYRGTVSDLGYDVGVLAYVYPGHRGFLPVNPETTEIYGALTYGVVTAKYSHAVTNAFGNANSTDSGYLEAAATFDLGKGWSLAPHIGHQRIAGAGNGFFSYTDYSVTANYDFGNGLIASAAALGTDARKGAYVTPNGRNTGRDGLVLGLKYSF